METKLSKVCAAMDSGDWKLAFSIASKFSRLGSESAAIMRAQSAFLQPDFYRQLGSDPLEIIESGKLAMKERFYTMRDNGGIK